MYPELKWVFYNKEADSSEKRLMVAGLYCLIKSIAQFYGQPKNILSVKCSKHTGQKLYFLCCFALSSTA